MITEIIEKLQENYDAIKNNDVHLYEHFNIKDSCLVPPGEPVTCAGKST